MANTFQWRFRVRSYEVGAAGEVHPATYLNYLEEMAIQASEALGFDYDWYLSHRWMWLVRKLTLREYAPAGINDELQLTTWISESRRVQANREYALRRASDDKLLLRGRHNWVFVNMETMLPERFPPEFVGKFAATGEVETLDLDPLDPRPLAAPIPHLETRRVRYQELDQNAHVNNAVYINWAEGAIEGALRSAGWPPDRLREEGVTMRRIGREIEYFRSAVDDEPIQISTQISAIGGERVAWATEIFQADTHDLIARDRAVVAFRDGRGACPPPEALVKALSYGDIVPTTAASAPTDPINALPK